MTAVTPVRPKNTAKLVEFQESALELGLVCFPLHRMRKQLGTGMARRICQRRGLFVYQSVAFSLDNFPLQAAEQIFPAHLKTSNTPSVMTWKAETQQEVTELTGSLLEESDFFCVDGTRSLKTEAESVVRVIAIILPGLEISWVADKDMERLYVNFMYLIADEDGELHKPKDSNRIEVGWRSTKRRQHARRSCRR